MAFFFHGLKTTYSKHQAQKEIPPMEHFYYLKLPYIRHYDMSWMTVIHLEVGKVRKKGQVFRIMGCF